MHFEISPLIKPDENDLKTPKAILLGPKLLRNKISNHLDKFPSGSYDNRHFKEKMAIAICKSNIKELKNKKVAPGDFSV